MVHNFSPPGVSLSYASVDLQHARCRSFYQKNVVLDCPTSGMPSMTAASARTGDIPVLLHAPLTTRSSYPRSGGSTRLAKLGMPMEFAVRLFHAETTLDRL